MNSELIQYLCLLSLKNHTLLFLEKKRDLFLSLTLPPQDPIKLLIYSPATVPYVWLFALNMLYFFYFTLTTASPLHGFLVLGCFGVLWDTILLKFILEEVHCSLQGAGSGGVKILYWLLAGRMWVPLGLRAFKFFFSFAQVEWWGQLCVCHQGFPQTLTPPTNPHNLCTGDVGKRPLSSLKWKGTSPC